MIGQLPIRLSENMQEQLMVSPMISNQCFTTVSDAAKAPLANVVTMTSASSCESPATLILIFIISNWN